MTMMFIVYLMTMPSYELKKEAFFSKHRQLAMRKRSRRPRRRIRDGIHKALSGENL
jgi:hypothetical protein